MKLLYIQQILRSQPLASMFLGIINGLQLQFLLCLIITIEICESLNQLIFFFSESLIFFFSFYQLK